MFEVFGVPAEVEQAYRALLRRADLAVPVEAAELDVPAQRTGTAFAELVAAGLLAESGGGWVVVPPELAFDALGARAERELEVRRRAIRRARDAVPVAVAEVVDSHRERLGTVAERLRGSDAVRARLHQLTAEVTGHVWSVNPGPAPPPRSVQASRAMDRTLRERGVTQRAVFAGVALTDPGLVAHLDEAAAAGDRLRVHPAPPTRLLLFDGTVAVVPLVEAEPEAGALVVHEPGLVSPLVTLFEQIWAAAVPFDPGAAPGADDADGPRIREVLTLLVTGHTDLAIARRLGVSTRTVGRLVAEAARRLQAGSRVETCVLALRAGWITDPGAALPQRPDAVSGTGPVHPRTAR